MLKMILVRVDDRDRAVGDERKGQRGPRRAHREQRPTELSAPLEGARKRDEDIRDVDDKEDVGRDGPEQRCVRFSLAREHCHRDERYGCHQHEDARVWRHPFRMAQCAVHAPRPQDDRHRSAGRQRNVQDGRREMGPADRCAGERERRQRDRRRKPKWLDRGTPDPREGEEVGGEQPIGCGGQVDDRDGAGLHAQTAKELLVVELARGELHRDQQGAEQHSREADQLERAGFDQEDGAQRRKEGARGRTGEQRQAGEPVASELAEQPGEADDVQRDARGLHGQVGKVARALCSPDCHAVLAATLSRSTNRHEESKSP
eukprot:2982336-Prymnesium_polylepis.1